MKPRRIIRITALLLNIVWYVQIIGYPFAILLFTLNPETRPPSYFVAEVSTEQSFPECAILSKSTGDTLSFVEAPCEFPLLLADGFCPITPPNTAWAILNGLYLLIGVLLPFGATFHLRKLFRYLKRDDSELDTTLALMQTSGSFSVWGSLWLLGFGLLSQLYLKSLVTAAGFSVRIDMLPDSLFFWTGLFILAFAEVLAWSTRKNEETPLISLND